MPHRLLRHLRHNVVAYLALFVAMGGTSAAAVDLANHSIDPVKLDSRYIGGYVRGWVSVGANGRILVSAGGARMIPIGDQPGHYGIAWRPFPSSSCTTIGSLDIRLFGPSTPGYVVTQTSAIRRQEATAVTTYDAQGQPASGLPFDIELLCRTPR